jgi:hypothetical protein
MLYFLPLAGCVAMGISSSQMAYRLVFAVATLFLLMKLVLTDYTWKELLLISVVMALLGYVFYRTGEKALIITAVSIFGCKDVDVKKVLKYTIFVYIIGMAITIGMVMAGKVQGEIHQLIKGGVKYEINDFGFSHPNSAYNHLMMIGLMAVVAWGKELRWYHYVFMTAAMFIGYKIFLSRTGLLIYLILCGALVLVYVVKWRIGRKVLGVVWALLPLGTAIASYILPILFAKNIELVKKLNNYLSGRIYLSFMAFERADITWFGDMERMWEGNYYIDNVYMNILLSCGILLCFLWVASLLLASFHYWKFEEYYILMAIGIISIYGFMEYAVINVTWNPILLFLAGSIFKEKKTTEHSSGPS